MPCSPQMSKCKASCLHRALVGDYVLTRHAQQEAANAAGYGHETEYQEYLESHPLITFKEWLIGSKREHEEEQAA